MEGRKEGTGKRRRESEGGPKGGELSGGREGRKDKGRRKVIRERRWAREEW